MFLIVSLNPALDKTLRVDRNLPNSTVRARERIDLAGGKGVNVARALLRLGARTEEVSTLLPLGGRSGAWVAELCEAEQIRLNSVHVAAQTRMALTIRADDTPDTWHYVEPGPEFQPDECEAIFRAFETGLRTAELVILSGSLPGAAAVPLLLRMVQVARERGKRVLLDSFDARLGDQALRLGPWAAKPNLLEWSVSTGEPQQREPGTPEGLGHALSRMVEWGIRCPVLSLGEHGAAAWLDHRPVRIHPAPVQEVNDLGSGDAMMAGMAWGIAREWSPWETLRFAAACGAANAAVWDPGGIDLATVQRLAPEVTASELG